MWNKQRQKQQSLSGEMVVDETIVESNNRMCKLIFFCGWKFSVKTQPDADEIWRREADQIENQLISRSNAE